MYSYINSISLFYKNDKLFIKERETKCASVPSILLYSKKWSEMNWLKEYYILLILLKYSISQIAQTQFQRHFDLNTIQFFSFITFGEWIIWWWWWVWITVTCARFCFCCNMFSIFVSVQWLQIIIRWYITTR